MSKPPSEWIPEAHRFLEAFDRRRTFGEFWDEYLARFGYENPDIAQPVDDPADLEAFRALHRALEPFSPSFPGKQDSDVIDPDAPAD